MHTPCIKIVFKKYFSFNFIERNLNPKAACLKRREEEKAEDGPKLAAAAAQHHMLPTPHYPAIPVSFFLKIYYFINSIKIENTKNPVKSLKIKPSRGLSNIAKANFRRLF